MKKTLIAIVLAATILMSGPALAASCDELSVSGLTDAQVIQLKAECVKATQSVQSPAETAAQVSEYAAIGMKYGVAISEVAKSIGTTVNELAFTPVGIFMLAIVGWKVIGGDLLGVVGGSIWFVVMLPFWWIMFGRLVTKRLYLVKETYTDTGKLATRTKTPVEWTDTTGVMAAVMIAILIAICISGFVMVF